MRPSPIARRYADAAFDVAQQDGSAEAWTRDLKSASGTISMPEVSQFFKDPNISHTDKIATLDRLFSNTGPEVMNLIAMLTLRDRLSLLPAILAEFVARDRAARGIVEAHITVARPYGEKEEDGITQRLCNVTGKTVEVRVTVDPAILGGIIIRIGDRLVDASVRGRLHRLRSEMAV
ncbi:MAG: F0F1 ATP synthase subunit delta [Chloroflexota bacterium]